MDCLEEEVGGIFGVQDTPLSISCVEVEDERFGSRQHPTFR